MTEKLHLDIKVVRGKGKGKYAFKEERRDLSLAEKLRQHQMDKDIEKNAVAQAKVNFQAERKRRLLESDWTEMTKAPSLTEEKKKQWAAYRQQLRDMPKRIKDWLNIEWPKVPE